MRYRVWLTNFDYPIHESDDIDKAKQACEKAGFECRVNVLDERNIEEGFFSWSPLQGYSSMTWNYL